MGFQGKQSMFTKMVYDLPREIPGDDKYFFRCTLLQCWGTTGHQHTLQNLSKTMITIASKTATSLANIHKSLDFIAKVVLDN